MTLTVVWWFNLHAQLRTQIKSKKCMLGWSMLHALKRPVLVYLEENSLNCWVKSWLSWLKCIKVIKTLFSSKSCNFFLQVQMRAVNYLLIWNPCSVLTIFLLLKNYMDKFFSARDSWLIKSKKKTQSVGHAKISNMLLLSAF